MVWQNYRMSRILTAVTKYAINHEILDLQHRQQSAHKNGKLVKSWTTKLLNGHIGNRARARISSTRANISYTRAPLIHTCKFHSNYRKAVFLLPDHVSGIKFTAEKIFISRQRYGRISPCIIPKPFVT